MPADRCLKLIIVGDEGAGKSALRLYLEGEEFSESYDCTFGVEVCHVPFKINQDAFNLTIFDTAGREDYRGLEFLNYRDVNAVLLVVDLTKPNLLKQMAYWRERFMRFKDEHVPVIIIGTKSDLPETQNNIDEFEKIIDPNKCVISCKSGKGLNEFRNAIQEVYFKLYPQQQKQVPKAAPKATSKSALKTIQQTTSSSDASLIKSVSKSSSQTNKHTLLQPVKKIKKQVKPAEKPAPEVLKINWWRLGGYSNGAGAVFSLVCAIMLLAFGAVTLNVFGVILLASLIMTITSGAMIMRARQTDEALGKLPARPNAQVGSSSKSLVKPLKINSATVYPAAKEESKLATRATTKAKAANANTSTGTVTHKHKSIKSKRA